MVQLYGNYMVSTFVGLYYRKYYSNIDASKLILIKNTIYILYRILNAVFFDLKFLNFWGCLTLCHIRQGKIHLSVVQFLICRQGGQSVKMVRSEVVSNCKLFAEEKFFDVKQTQHNMIYPLDRRNTKKLKKQKAKYRVF